MQLIINLQKSPTRIMSTKLHRETGHMVMISQWKNIFHCSVLKLLNLLSIMHCDTVYIRRVTIVKKLTKDCMSWSFAPSGNQLLNRYRSLSLSMLSWILCVTWSEKERLWSKTILRVFTLLQTPPLARVDLYTILNERLDTILWHY